MKHLNYYLQAFGFSDSGDYLKSTFGYILNSQGISFSLIVAALSAFLNSFLGFDLFVFTAFVALNILEFRTGLRSAKRKGKKVESRKMGRMFLKVGTYVLIIGILNTFQVHLNFPSVFDFELDPFIALYWLFLAAIIFQLLISLLENLANLGWEEAEGVKGVVIRWYNKHFGKTDVE